MIPLSGKRLKQNHREKTGFDTAQTEHRQDVENHSSKPQSLKAMGKNLMLLVEGQGCGPQKDFRRGKLKLAQNVFPDIGNCFKSYQTFPNLTSMTFKIHAQHKTC